MHRIVLTKNDIIETGVSYEIRHRIGYTEFTGCQCWKDCDCKSEFKSNNFDNYSITRTGKKHKLTIHDTLELAHIRLLDFIK